MAALLYRLGRFAFRHRYLVVLLWISLLTVGGVAAAQAPASGPTTFAMPGTESQRAYDLIDERFEGQKADGATARVVFKAPEGHRITEPALREAIGTAVETLASGAEVDRVTDPFKTKAVSGNQAAAYAQVSYEVSAAELSEASRDELADAVAEASRSGMTVEAGGATQKGGKGSHAAEAIGLAVAAVVLLLTLGSLIAAGLPLVTALIGVAIGVCSITALASTLELDSTTSVLAMMLGLAVGIDYALFIVSRYRSELAEGRRPEDAAGRALGTAGSTVVFAGLTVVIALAGLAVVDIPLLTKMGVAAAGTVVLAVLVALTLVPALLGIAGRRIKAPRTRHKAARAGAAEGAEAVRNMGSRWAAFVIRRPVPVLVVGMVALCALAVPAASLQLGLPDEGSQPESTTQRRAYDLISENFGPGFNGPLLAVADAKDSDNPKQAVSEVSAVLKGIDGVSTVSPPRFNEAGDTAMITVIPESRPGSAETEAVVHAIRDAGGDVMGEDGGRLMVSGSTAMNIDVSQKLDDALLPYLALVVGLAFLLLIMVFRSLAVPLKAALGFLFSVAASLGAVVAVFQWGWLASLIGVTDPGPVMSMMPIFMVGIVFGLAMDYEVFLVTRIREAYIGGHTAREAIVTGFRHSARVVTAAALIMIAVFAGFIGSDEQMVKTIGFGLAAAVFIDAFVVRMTLVPAVLALMGDKAWWLPLRLEAVLPRVDIEGDGLRAEDEPDEIAALPGARS
ncbi:MULTISPECIES: MMPL family transporter [unclassified Streptomyces]|uniref:MMPL family transporter n=1 Tax=unclassified Streptomyces TaxID=2593676 RepID=UPI00225B21DB|nr:MULTISPECIES: MMPL family transporter [unclassified Streptomyces]MCX5105283.1 MMPL family transporter [Streptomyces sp. NBC_00439]WSP46031.1 MMPL family transporter [Streptomyces sp. NBC_01243]